MDFYVDEKTKDNSNNTEIKNSSPQDLIDRGFSEIEAQVKLELLDKLKSIDPYCKHSAKYILRRYFAGPNFQDKNTC